MAAAIEKALGIKPELVEGRGGIFDVSADGELIFSKHAMGRFPETSELIEKLRGL